MKQILRTLFSPILNIFEKGDDPFEYKSLNRKILIFMGFIFAGLATLVVLFVPEGVGLGYLIPVVVFGFVALITLVVGFLGNERAVTKIWGDR
ncbi:MAG: hypothetical protein HN475_01320 [Piscirickettsiaceae bacterium]|nr:hypothetical protein [Piscirickettsiaceae bacterium]